MEGAGEEYTHFLASLKVKGKGRNSMGRAAQYYEDDSNVNLYTCVTVNCNSLILLLPPCQVIQSLEAFDHLAINLSELFLAKCATCIGKLH